MLQGLGVFAFLFGHRLGAEGRLPTSREITRAAVDGSISVGVDIFFRLFLPWPNPYVDAALSSLLAGFLAGLADKKFGLYLGAAPGMVTGEGAFT